MLQFIVWKVNLFDIKTLNSFDNGLDLLYGWYFSFYFYLCSKSNIIENNKKMTTAKEALWPTESKLDTFLSQHNIEEIIRKKIYTNLPNKRSWISPVNSNMQTMFFHMVYDFPSKSKNYKISVTKIAHHHFRGLLFRM